MHETAPLAYVTLFAPLAATVLITLFTLKSKALSAALALGGIFLGLGCTIAMAAWIEQIGRASCRERVCQYV